MFDPGSAFLSAYMEEPGFMSPQTYVEPQLIAGSPSFDLSSGSERASSSSQGSPNLRAIYDNIVRFRAKELNRPTPMPYETFLKGG